MVGEEIAGARKVLADNVVALDPERSVFEAMVQGWAQQQRARFLREATIGPRVRLVHRLAEFTGLYPWQWTPEEGEAWVSDLRSGPTPLRFSTVRGYQVDIGLFCSYLLDSRYGWITECTDRFGRAPLQVFHEDNSIIHVDEYEGDEGRRPLTYDETQALFDAADGRVAQIRARRRKGALSALRDAVALKYTYAYGLRRKEVSMTDVVDLRRNSKFPAFGRFGAVTVRSGKASRGGPPKRRTVLTVPEMSWIVDLLDQYLAEIRSEYDHTGHPALFLTERGSRLSVRAINTAFATARDAAGLDPRLDLHSLRHSYVTHLVEFDYPERFIQEQVGHAFSSITAVYVGVSNEYRNGLLTQSIHARYGHHFNDGTT